jgi:ubiquinone/menaquinone biosynthesis C-methylase UbiE
MKSKDYKYIPALSKDWLTPVYDPFVRFLMKDEWIKKRLIELALPGPGEHVLDVGCGTGTLDLMIKRYQPAAFLTGIDGDEKILEIARQKAARAGLSDIRWDKGMAFDLPYADGSFDLVVSSLMIHHLALPDKLRMFQEVYRVLRPEGRFYILDIGAAWNRRTRLIAFFMSHLERARENFEGQIPALLSKAHFVPAAEVERLPAFFGLLSIYEARRSADKAAHL